MCFESEKFLILGRNEQIWLKKMHIGLRAKCTLFLADLNETWIYQQMFEKASNIKFHENPSSEYQVVHADRRADMTKLIVVFLNFAIAPKTVWEGIHKSFQKQFRQWLTKGCSSSNPTLHLLEVI